MTFLTYFYQLCLSTVYTDQFQPLLSSFFPAPSYLFLTLRMKKKRKGKKRKRRFLHTRENMFAYFTNLMFPASTHFAVINFMAD